MKNPFLWVAFYSLIMALGQMLLKTGTNQLGVFNLKDIGGLVPLLIRTMLNPFIFLGMVLFVTVFFLWLAILSSFPLGMVFPLTAMMYIFVAWMSFFTLGETLSAVNYFGMTLIALGVYFLLQR